MNTQEYKEKFFDKGVIGLCELCHNFKDCARHGTLKGNGCYNHSDFSE